MMDHHDIIKEIREACVDECYTHSQKNFWIRQCKCHQKDLSDWQKPVEEKLTVPIQKE